MKAIKIVTPRSRKLRYASKKAQEARQNELYRDTYGDWADYRPRRDFGVFANERSTYKRNGEVVWS